VAIALDAATTSAESTSGTLAWNHTVGAGANFIAVGIFATDDSASSQPTVTSVTCGGVSMTKARADQKAGIDNCTESSIWFLKNPGSGVKAISAAITNNDASAGVSVSYSGVADTSTADAVGGNTGTTATGSQTFTVTTVADNCWIFAVCGALDDNGVPTIAGNFTSRGSFTYAETWDHGFLRAQDTNAAQTPAGAKTVGFTLGNMAFPLCWSMSGASFAPAASGTKIPVFMNQYKQRWS
jgi:hypothetical protein